MPSRIFEGCSKLTSVEFGDNVKEIGAMAFADCYLIEKLPHGSFEKIGECAFYGCKNLKEFYVGTLDNSISYGTYYACNSFEIGRAHV